MHASGVSGVNEILVFQGRAVRMMVNNGEPWWVARDVCDVLGIRNSRQALAYLDDDEKGVITTDTHGGRQEVATINESGLYSLVLRSRKPEAKAFKRWVTKEVLPSIRRTGQYVVPREPALVMDDSGIYTGEGLTRKLANLDARLARIEGLGQRPYLPAKSVGRPPVLREECRVWLRAFLLAGPRPRAEVIDAGRRLGFSRRMLDCLAGEITWSTRDRTKWRCVWWHL
jgi:hypothetical protein